MKKQRSPMLLAALLGALILVLTMGTNTTASASTSTASSKVSTFPILLDRIGPYDDYGTYPDSHYGYNIIKGTYGQLTWSKTQSIWIKHRWQDLGATKDIAYGAATSLCGMVPTPMGTASCAIFVTKDYVYFKDTMANVGRYQDNCVSIRWYAVGAWNAGRTFSPVNCFTAADDCCPPGGGPGGGGGGGGSWRPSRPVERGVTMGTSKVAFVGSGGGSW